MLGKIILSYTQQGKKQEAASFAGPEPHKLAVLEPHKLAVLEPKILN
jgi:hypothetical protein